MPSPAMPCRSMRVRKAWPAALMAVALGAVFLASRALAEDEGQAAQTLARPLPQPAAGSRLPAVAVAAAPVRFIDFGALAREQAKLPPAPGPLVGLGMPEGEGYVEPNAEAPPITLRVSGVHVGSN